MLLPSESNVVTEPTEPTEPNDGLQLSRILDRYPRLKQQVCYE